MTDPISSVTRLQPQLLQRAFDPPAATAAPAAAETDATSPKMTAPVSLSVDRDASGVFVYTLTDSASGRVIAVIPRSAMAPQASGGGGAGLDIQA